MNLLTIKKEMLMRALISGVLIPAIVLSTSACANTQNGPVEPVSQNTRVDRNPRPGQAVAVAHANAASCPDVTFVNLTREQGKAIQYLIAQKM